MFTSFIEKYQPKSARGKKIFRYSGYIAAMVVAWLIPSYIATGTDGPLPLFTIVLCAVYALFALGLNIVVGFAGLLDLGYVAFFLFGAYTSAWLMSDFFYQEEPTRTVKQTIRASTSTSSRRRWTTSRACTCRSGW